MAISARLLYNPPDAFLRGGVCLIAAKIPTRVSRAENPSLSPLFRCDHSSHYFTQYSKKSEIRPLPLYNKSMENALNKRQPPDILYQYRPPTARALGNLCKQVLYFSAPESFNDPYEWRIPPRILKGATSGEIASVTENRGKKISAPLSRHDINRRFKRTFERWRRDGGVACLSESRCEMLMWSHYAGRHKGFCLAFDSGLHLYDENRLVPVCYSAEPPKCDASEIEQSQNSDDSFMSLMCTKPKYWEYEKEWRFIRRDTHKSRTGRESYYESTALKAVYLGAVAEKGTKRDVYNIIKKNYPDTELWQMRLSRNKYKMGRSPVNEAACATHKKCNP